MPSASALAAPPELPPAEPIDTVPRTLKQAGLLELEEATAEPEIT